MGRQGATWKGAEREAGGEGDERSRSVGRMTAAQSMARGGDGARRKVNWIGSELPATQEVEDAACEG